jgi:hypothetical protein
MKAFDKCDNLRSDVLPLEIVEDREPAVAQFREITNDFDTGSSADK